MEGTISLMLCNAGDFIAGMFMGVFNVMFERIPALLALLPGATDARGDVYSSFGSRLGTLLHLGMMNGERSSLREELFALAVIIIAINAWVGLLASIIAVVLRGELVGLELVFIALSSAVLSAVFMVPATTWLAMVTFSKGLDPDNFTAPVSTLFGDCITVPTIFAGFMLALILPLEMKVVFIVICGVLASAGILRIARSEMERAKRIVKECLPTIMFTTFLSTLAGTVLLVNVETFLEVSGLLTIIPAFLEDGGAIACRFAARLSTMLHLGEVEPEMIPRNPLVLSQVLVNCIHAVMVFSLVGVFGYAISNVLELPILPLPSLLVVTLAAGLLTVMLVNVLTYYITVAAFRLGLDPDNVTAPLLTSIVDLIGSLSLVAAILLVK